MDVDIKKLITAAEEIVNDPQLGFCATTWRPIQNFTVDGVEYQLQVLVTSEDILPPKIT